ncbi:redoxin family protein [Pseudomonas sp. HK3]|jgi:glutathione peroxidase-family protein
MRNIFILTCVAAISFFSFKAILGNAVYAIEPTPLPEFTQTQPQNWLKSKPLKKSDLKGKVVLMDIWTFSCWNCYRSFPWLNSLATSFKQDDFQVIGIHSPEFDHEKKPQAVLKKMDEFKLEHPVMIDNDFTYWRALNNQYWPTFYLIDKTGSIRYRFIGETHADTAKAKKIEQAIALLLAE